MRFTTVAFSVVLPADSGRFLFKARRSGKARSNGRQRRGGAVTPPIGGKMSLLFFGGGIWQGVSFLECNN